MRLYHLIHSVPFLASWVDDYIENRAKRIEAQINPFLTKKGKILDIGSGTGHTDHILINKGYDVTCLDLNDMNIFENTKPIIYDGKKIPFKNNSFDQAMILTVLHHTPDPEQIILGAKRVAKQIVIMEDTYNNFFQKIATFVMDSIGNLEFFGHPHTNKNDREWRELFKKNGLKLLGVRKEKYMWVFEGTTYHLETIKSGD